MGDQIGTAYVGLELDGSAYLAQLKEFKSKTEATFKEMDDAFRKASASWAPVSAIAQKAFLALSAGITAATIAAVKFEKQMAHVSTQLTGPGASALDIYGAGVLDLSIKYAQGTDAIANSLYEVLNAGIGTKDAMGVVEAAVISAGGEFAQLESVTKLTLDILKAYGMEASRAGEITDKLAILTLNGRGELEAYAGALGNVIPMAKSVGLALDQVVGSLAAATRAGVAADTAVTGLQAIMMTFQKPSEQAAAAARMWGFELNVNTLQTIGLTGVMKKLKGARADDIIQIFENRRALTFLNPLLNDTAGFIDDVSASANSSGAALDKFGKATAGVHQSFGQLKQASIAALVAIGQGFAEFLSATGVIDALVGALGAVRAAMEALGPTGRTIAAGFAFAATALAGLLVLMPAIVGGFAALNIAAAAMGVTLGALVLKMALITGGVTLLLGALALGTKAFIDWRQAQEPAIKGVEDLNRALKESSQQVKEYSDQQKTIQDTLAKYDQLTAKQQSLQSAGKATTEVHKELKDQFDILTKNIPNLSKTVKDYTDGIISNRGAIESYLEKHRALAIQLINSALAVAKANEMTTEKERNLAQERADSLGAFFEYESATYDAAIQKQKEYQQQVDSIQTRIRSARSTGVEPLKIDTDELDEAKSKLEIWTGTVESSQVSMNKSSAEWKQATAILEKYAQKTDEVTRLEEMKMIIEEKGLNAVRNISDANEEAASTAEMYKRAMDQLAAATDDGVRSFEYLDNAVKFVQDELTDFIDSGEAAASPGVMGEMVKELAGLIKDRAEALDKAVENEDKTLKAQEDFYADHYQRIERLSGWSTQTIISDIEARQAALERGNQEWWALEEQRVKYTEDVQAEIVGIWRTQADAMKGSISDSLAGLFTGTKGPLQGIKDLGDTMKNSMAKAFADTLTSKLSFDNLFTKNMFDLGKSATGLGNTITQTLGGAFGLLGGGGAGEQTFDIAATGITGMGEAAEYTATELADMGATFTKAGDTTWVNLTATDLNQLGEAAEYTTAELAEMGQAATTAGTAATSATSALGAMPGIGTAIAVGVSGITSGIDKLSKASKAGNAEVRTYAAGIANIALPATALIPELGGVGDGLSAVAAGAAYGTMILPGFGTAVGAAAGALAGFGEELGLIKHSMSWETEWGQMYNTFTTTLNNMSEENKAFYDQASQYTEKYFGKQRKLYDMSAEEQAGMLAAMKGEGLIDEVAMEKQAVNLTRYARAQEDLFNQMWTRVANYSNDYWDHESSMLDKSYAERNTFYEQQKGLGIYTDEQLLQLRDALQLYDTVEERQGAAERTAKEAAANMFQSNMWDAFKDNVSLLDEAAGAQEAFAEAVRRSNEDGIDVTQAFQEEMAKLGPMSEETTARIQKAFSETINADDFMNIAGTVTNSFRDMQDQMAASFYKTGADAEDAFKKIEDVSTKWLQGWDIDLRENLMNIPGMTGAFADKLVEEMASLKDLGVTKFDLGPAFEEGVKGRLADINLALSQGTIEEALANYRATGKLAGEGFKAGFEEGASGSGILGDVLFDEKTLTTAADRYAKAGADSGDAFKRGFTKSGRLDNLAAPGTENGTRTDALAIPALPGGPGQTRRLGLLSTTAEDTVAEIEAWLARIMGDQQGQADLFTTMQKTMIKATDSVGRFGAQTTVGSEAVRLLGWSAQKTGEGQGELTEAFKGFEGETGKFKWDNYFSLIDWNRYIRMVNLGDFVTGIELPGATGLQHGTAHWRGGAAIVGEAGPELINLPRGARVTPLAGLAGGGITLARGAVRVYTGPINTARDEADLEDRIGRSLERALERAVRG